MFYALPAETVFEAKERTRRATFYLFILLVVLYVFFADLLVAAACLMANVWFEMHIRTVACETPLDFWSFILFPPRAAVAWAVGLLMMVPKKPLDDMLEKTQTSPADPKDSYHQQFINLVKEAEAA